MDTQRKNYTLCVKIYDQELELLKGTLEEIDDFTTYFSSSDSMFRLLSSNIDINRNNYSFYIRSSKGKIYDVIYHSKREILLKENENMLIDKLKQVNRQTMINFLKDNTDVVKYSNSTNSNAIPLVRIYNNMLSGNLYHLSLENYIKSDYKARRTFARGKYDLIDFLGMKKKPIDKDKKEKIAHYAKDTRDKIYEIYESVNEQKEEYFEPTNENIEDRAFDILNNSELSTEEKLTELDMIFNDSEKYSDFVSKYVYSNEENNGKTYR